MKEWKSGKVEGRGDRRWLKRIGVAGFLFFLVKGLIWIGLFFGIQRFIGG